jgi:hypothetical protein
MTDPFKISARNAGATAVESYCPRCFWYLLRLKRLPFNITPGILNYMEQMQKAFVKGHLAKHRRLPAAFGPFADCTKPVDFPYAMEALHSETGVIVTARPDMMLLTPKRKTALLDLKTSKPDGGGKVFHPQYEVQVVGYSWVAQENGIGPIEKTGLVYCWADTEAFKEDPLSYKTDNGISVPFKFKGEEVPLDLSRLTKALKESKRIWQLSQPPRGRDKCKDCALFARIFDLEDQIRQHAKDMVLIDRRYAEQRVRQDYYRQLTRSLSDAELLRYEVDQLDKDSILLNWDFEP